MARPAPTNSQESKGLFALRTGVSAPALIGLLVVTIAAGTMIWTYSQRERSDVMEDVEFTPVVRGPYKHILLERGQVESEINVELRCEVRSRSAKGTEIQWLVDEGTQVKRGETVVVLDQTVLDQELVQQRIVCNRARASVVEAENTLRATEISRAEYLQGTFRKEEQASLGEIFVAEESLHRAQLALQFTERLAAKGTLTSLQSDGDRFVVQRAKNELAAAEAELEILRRYTKEKTVKQFDGDIATAAARWDAAKKSYQLEIDKLRDIEEQIEKCTIVAPDDGQAVYANVFDHHGAVEFVVEAGAFVHERQVILRLPDPKKMQVRVAISEPRVSLIKPGLSASIQFNAIPGPSSRGEVAKVNQYAEPVNFHSSSIRQYATWISILDPPSEVRSGMGAEVRICVEQRENALQIPVKAIYETKGRFFCLLKNSKGWETREVLVGSSNDTTISIEANLAEGQRVVMYPRNHADKLQLPALPGEVGIGTSDR